MFKEFKEFVRRGNVMDMAIGIVIGAAFGAIVQSLVADVITPPLGLLIDKVAFSNLFIVLKQGDPSGPYLSLMQAKEAGAVTINYGVFLNSVIRFLVVAGVIFWVIRILNRMKRKEESAAPSQTKVCPYCQSGISIQARRCPYCTSNLD